MVSNKARGAQFACLLVVPQFEFTLTAIVPMDHADNVDDGTGSVHGDCANPSTPLA